MGTESITSIDTAYTPLLYFFTSRKYKSIVINDIIKAPKPAFNCSFLFLNMKMEIIDKTPVITEKRRIRNVD